jgi:ABC-type cobalamin/Fe3+-siderophores transport system ATPase subunit
MADFTFKINQIDGSEKTFDLNKGNSLLIVGANGSGKTRLAATIEQKLPNDVHRIAAQRVLKLNTAVPKIPEREAGSRLRSGSKHDDYDNRIGNRWQSDVYTSQLNDFDALIQVLFADQTNIAVTKYYDPSVANAKTKLEQLKTIWENINPQMQLIITGDNIEVRTGTSAPYNCAQMSDGERSMFYLIGQALCTKPNSILITDEPELHMHKAIMGKLWDEIEAARPDCAFIFITHDLEFAASRVGQKIVVSNYDATHQRWQFEDVPMNTGFSEIITTEILGSRRPILFVEGEHGSLDISIYRNNYPEWTVIPCGSCEDVIHSVASMRRNALLTRVTCTGIVDGDDYSSADMTALNTIGVKVLPVSEIENLLLMPQVVDAIAVNEGLSGQELTDRINALNDALITHLNAGNNIERAVTDYCRRRIDRVLKKIDLSGGINVQQITQIYTQETSNLDITAIATARDAKIRTAVTNRNIPEILSLYDNKGLVALVAEHIKRTRKKDLEAWIVRVLGNKSVPTLSAAFSAILPQLTPA